MSDVYSFGDRKVNITKMAKATKIHQAVIYDAMENWSMERESKRVLGENTEQLARQKFDMLKSPEEMDRFMYCEMLPGWSLMSEAYLRREALWLKLLRETETKEGILKLISNIQNWRMPTGEERQQELIGFAIQKLSKFYRK